MTAIPPRPLRVTATDRTAAILRRCYHGQPPADVLERALRMLATADGHLHPDGRIRTRSSQPGRQP